MKNTKSNSKHLLRLRKAPFKIKENNPKLRTFTHYEKTIKIKPKESMGKFYIALEEYKNELNKKIKLAKGMSFELYAKETKNKDGFIFFSSIVPKGKNRLFENRKLCADVLM